MNGRAHTNEWVDRLDAWLERRRVGWLVLGLATAYFGAHVLLAVTGW